MGIDEKRWARLAAETQFTELGRLRTQAANWRTGLAGLTGLLTAVLIVKGPQSVEGLPGPARWWVPVLVGLALILLLTGSVLAMRAAYGTPGPRMILTGERLRAWTREEVRRVRARLIVSSALFVAGTALVAIAVGLTWLAPGPKTGATSLVTVVTTAGTTCGRLISGDAQGVLVASGPANASRITALPYTAIRYIAPVSSCPS